MKKIMFVFGTRPEAIKMWPIIRQARLSSRIRPIVCVTSQQLNLQDQALKCLDLSVDYDLSIMVPDQTLDHIVAAVLSKLGPVLDQEKPEIVVVQGDTTTAFSAGLAAFHRHIPVAHVEAGLRTYNQQSPFPEEMNRVLLSRLATWHFVATEQNRQNLVREGVPDERIRRVGNPVVDAVHLVLSDASLESEFQTWAKIALPFNLAEPYIVATLHRRENFGEPLNRIWKAITSWMIQNPTWHCIVPLHPNPRVREILEKDRHQFPNLHLTEPIDYFKFLFLLKSARFSVSDSGGIQEEAPTLKVPVVLVRETTERPEALESGWVKMVGTDGEAVFNQMSGFQNPSTSDIRTENPFGSGDSGQRIIQILEELVG